jgi:hypothetical protein
MLDSCLLLVGQRLLDLERLQQGGAAAAKCVASTHFAQGAGCRGKLVNNRDGGSQNQAGLEVVVSCGRDHSKT